MRVKLLRVGAQAPSRARDGDAGYDLAYCDGDSLLEANQYDVSVLKILVSVGEWPVVTGHGFWVRPYSTVSLPTGVALDFSDAVRSLRHCRCPSCCPTMGVVGLVQDRSSLARRGLHVVGGVIDSGYRGEVGVVLHNASDQPIHVSPGDRVAQLVLLPVLTPEVEVVDELAPTERGAAGFGSSDL